jgi:hypothetical protein
MQTTYLVIAITLVLVAITLVLVAITLVLVATHCAHPRHNYSADYTYVDRGFIVRHAPNIVVTPYQPRAIYVPLPPHHASQPPYCQKI